MSDQEKEKEIISAALELFMKYGIKSLTMDDIARHLHISKKTLYQYVSDKKDLVKKGMELAISDECQVVNAVANDSSNAIDELIEITKCVSTRLREMHPSVLYDIQKYHPKSWDLMKNHKTEFVYGVMLENLKRGVKEKYYRKNINPQIVASIYMMMMENIMNAESPLSKTISLPKLHLEMINYHFNGICNQKGLGYLEKAIKKEQLIILSID
jgi:hypothetical protein